MPHHAVFPLKNTRFKHNCDLWIRYYYYNYDFHELHNESIVFSGVIRRHTHTDRWPVNGDWRCPGRNNVDAFYRNKTVVSKRFTLRVIYLFGKTVVAKNPLYSVIIHCILQLLFNNIVCGCAGGWVCVCVCVCNALPEYRAYVISIRV